MPDPANILIEFVERLRKEREFWKAQQFEPLPEPPEEPPRNRYKLQFRPGVNPGRPTISLDEARQAIESKIMSYLSERKPGRNLLIQAQPGVGKTHIAVDVIQCLAGEQRAFFAMLNHAHYETLMDLPHAAPGLWYHWLALSAESPITGNTMCQYADVMTDWTGKGYPAMGLCDSLCPVYKSNCEYRRQALVDARIIAGTHDHAALGMQVSDFDLGVIDELPLNAFLRPRKVPASGLRLYGVGPVADLSAELALACLDLGEHTTLSGKALMERIYPILIDAYAQFDDYEGALPSIPLVSRPSDVDRAPYWYMADLLILLVQELAAYEAGQSEWLERVILSKAGLEMLKRTEPWNALPAHLVILDATGNETIYRQIFDRQVEVFAPIVERAGRVYQVTGRLNGIGTFLEIVPGEKNERRTKRRRLSRQGIEALDWCEQVIALRGYRDPGCITFLDAVPEFEAVFGKGRVLHFFAQRGSNTLLDCDAGFVVGCPQPRDSDIMKAVTALYPQRSRPYHLVERDGVFEPHPARTEELRAYQYFDDRGQAERMVSGFWNDPDLNAMADIQREQEIVQAVHRFRPITRGIDVYVLTSTPTAEPLDGIYDDLPEALRSVTGASIPPEISNWRGWLKLQPQLMEWHLAGQAVDNRMIAEFLGISENTIRRWNWLNVILAEYPDLWQADRIAPKGRGRPQNGLFPVKNE